MKISLLNKIALSTLLLGGFVSHGIAQNAPYTAEMQSGSSDITETSPTANERDVDLDTQIEVTFAKEMDTNSINERTILLREHAANGNAMSGMQRSEMYRSDVSSEQSEAASDHNRMRTSDTVSGTIRYSDNVAVFTPDINLKEGTTYTVSVTTDVKDSENVALEDGRNWSFTTESSSGAMLYNERINDGNNERNN